MTENKPISNYKENSIMEEDNHENEFDEQVKRSFLRSPTIQFDEFYENIYQNMIKNMDNTTKQKYEFVRQIQEQNNIISDNVVKLCNELDEIFLDKKWIESNEQCQQILKIMININKQMEQAQINYDKLDLLKNVPYYYFSIYPLLPERQFTWYFGKYYNKMLFLEDQSEKNLKDLFQFYFLVRYCQFLSGQGQEMYYDEINQTLGLLQQKNYQDSLQYFFLIQDDIYGSQNFYKEDVKNQYLLNKNSQQNEEIHTNEKKQKYDTICFL